MRVDRFSLEEAGYTGKSYYVYMRVGRWSEDSQMLVDDWTFTTRYDAEFDSFTEAFSYASASLTNGQLEEIIEWANGDRETDSVQFLIDEDVWNDGNAEYTSMVGGCTWVDKGFTYLWHMCWMAR